MNTISRDEWLSALKDAGLHEETDDQAVTINEFAAMFDLKINTAQHRLAALVAAGKAMPARKRGIDARGHIVIFNAYRLTPTSGTNKPKRGKT